MEGLEALYYDPSIASGRAELDKLKTKSNAELKDEQMKKVAKDFEAIFLRQMVKNMNETVPDSELFESSQFKQINSMFWSFLADDLAGNGGIGMWKNIYEEMKRNDLPEVNLLLDSEA